MRLNLRWRNIFRRNTRAVAPAISTVIITCAIIVMVFVAMVYAQNYLTGQLAQNEFNTNQQFMLTTGLQIDDIAWTIGRTQTIQYSCQYSFIQFESQAISYSIDINFGNSSGWVPLNDSLLTGVLLYNMPPSSYSLGHNFFEPIFPTQISFLQEGPSAPVSQVYIMEKLPMTSGNYTRVVVAPSFRMINSTIGSQSYVKFYLPLLMGGPNPELSQSVTLVGSSVTQYLCSNVTEVRLRASFPQASEGFDETFFPFGNQFLMSSYYEQDVVLAPNSVVEFYVGEVTISIGAFV